jgi:hypothetical protein
MTAEGEGYQTVRRVKNIHRTNALLKRISCISYFKNNVITIYFDML